MSVGGLFCRHPQDREGCQEGLIEAWKASGLLDHCLFEGLQANLDACRDLLKRGLYDEHQAGRDPRFFDTDLYKACKEVVLLGYPRGIKAIHEVFYEVYYRRVRTLIHRYGIKDTGQPSAVDVFQSVFLELHRYFSKGVRVDGPLHKYIGSSVIYRCLQAKRPGQRCTRISETEDIPDKRAASGLILSVGSVELWEDHDHRLARSNEGDLINRILLAYLVLGAITTHRRVSARWIKSEWEHLLQMDDHPMDDFIDQIVAKPPGHAHGDVIRMSAELINAGQMAPHQVAIVLAAGTGLNRDATKGLLAQLAGLKDSEIHTRLFRIRRILRPPEPGQE